MHSSLTNTVAFDISSRSPFLPRFYLGVIVFPRHTDIISNIMMVNY